MGAGHTNVNGRLGVGPQYPPMLSSLFASNDVHVQQPVFLDGTSGQPLHTNNRDVTARHNAGQIALQLFLPPPAVTVERGLRI